MERFTHALFAALVLAAPAAAQDKPEDVVTRAIKETGGDAVLKKFPAGVSQMKGKMILAGMDLPFTGSMTYAVPGKVKMEVAVEIGGQKVSMVQVVDGTKVKQTENGKQVENITEAAKTELQQGAMLQEIALLYPLLDPKRYTLKDAKGTADTNAVLVEGKDLKPVTLFFDKKSGLLTKMTRKGVSPSGMAVDEETTYADYKEVSGIKVPMSSKVMHADKLYLDITVTEFKPLETTDEKFDTGS